MRRRAWTRCSGRRRWREISRVAATRTRHDRRRSEADFRRRAARRPARQAAEAHVPHRDRRLDQSRQAGRRVVDPGGRAAQVPFQRQEGGPRRDARSARLGRAAGRVRRGDEDRADRSGRRQGLPLPRPLGRGKRDRRRRGRDRRAFRPRPAPAEIEALLPRFVGNILQTPPAFSAIQSTARAPTISRAKARPSRCNRARSSSIAST